MEALIPVAAETGCNVIALLWGPDGVPRDSNERASILVELVHGLMDGNEPDPSTLTGTALEHYKTYKVLSGQIVFSESWLEL